MITVGPVGKVVEGDVLDCNKANLERALKDYDHQLYLKWNPKKIKGHGCWELRRRPSYKTIKAILELDGKSYILIDYVEHDIVHHVKDMAFLDYRILEWVKDHDLYTQTNFEVGQEHRLNNWSADLDKRGEAARAKIKQDQYKEAMYGLLQNKTAIREYKEAILSGTNPAHIAKYWK